MVKEICKDVMILSIVSIEATIDDINVAKDLLDTLQYNSYRCVGMAANMIGVNKRIIVFYDENIKNNVVMFNPVIIQQQNEYEIEEGCLCFEGLKKTKRYKKIVVNYRDVNFKLKTKTYNGFTAQIIQHEIDMINGILI